MLRKKEVYVQITPIPAHIPRQLAVDILHSHGEIITLNPLVLDYKPIKAPREAEADEFFSTWYEIEERIQYVPGMGRLGSGKISFKGCFHDMPWGVQTHTYAPMNIDLRNKWQVCGNQPGEPAAPRELGIGAPASGLYLREDVEIKANITMISFVKSEMKKSAKTMVDRMIKKAELLDAGVLQAMMEDGKLKTHNPADLSSFSGQGSPGLPPPAQPSVGTPTLNPASPTLPYQSPHFKNAHMSVPAYGHYGQPAPAPHGGHYSDPHAQYAQHQQQQHQQQPQQTMMELPGDMYYAQQGQHSPSMYPPQPSPHSHTHSPHLQHLRPTSTASDYSQGSPHLTNARWSTSSGPTSYSSDTTGMKSPGLEQRGFATELPTHSEEQSRGIKASLSQKESRHASALNKLEGNPPIQPNPAIDPVLDKI